MKRVYFSFLILTILASCKSQYADLGDGLFADIKTSKGNIIVRLEHEKTPVTVANFVTLAEGTSPFVSEEFKDKKFYDGLTFHRVMNDFMIQGGDPTATGSGSPGYRFMDELTDSLHHDKKGILSMANSGFETNGSQFFITHKATPWLDGYENGFLKNCKHPRIACHTVFGEVTEGLDVIDSIATVPVDPTSNKPLDNVTMNTVSIIRNGKNAKSFNAVQVMTDYFAKEEEKLAALNKLKSEMVTAFEEQIAKAEELPSGLKILKLTEGEGEKPKVGQKVKIHHAGFLKDGSLFDSSVEEVATKFGAYDQSRKDSGNYEPWEIDYSPEARLISGFKEGLLTMRVGDKIRVFIPPHLGYGAQGSGPIPPNSDLVFDLELVSIVQ